MNDTILSRRDFVRTAAAGTGTIAGVLGTGYTLAANPAASENALAVLHDHLKESILEFADAMPGEHYGFKPTPEIESYAGQLLHIALSNYRLGSIIKGEKIPEIDLEPDGKSKDDIREALERSFSYSAAILLGLNDSEAHEEVPLFSTKVTKYNAALLLRNHISHHRGQCVIYLRLKGIKPPQYRGL